ncbi:MAG: carbamoyltransferase HypF [Caldiserica bacterium]|jgi:hydrogenase maturation protein HypF|nr:carbamoyltransferase HypF [Caldisericota bacterium]MDH7562046.1 carbamoyltransferase HypF [Caldisericota bacterium]
MGRFRIRVEGIVQGVGFRPFIHNLALKYNLKGWVLNSPDGVLIEVEGEQAPCFLRELKEDPPPLAVVESLEVEELEPVGYEGFQIRSSRTEEEPITLIPPDVATCDDCLREMRDPSDRRYRYPFLNCTNCGPRFTIIESLPYDRSRTSMKRFSMCPDCQREYRDLNDRRYHAQPVACPKCGPRLFLKEGEATLFDEEALKRAKSLMKEGKILAIKGLGGFHLACDATQEAAVLELRKRKGRPHKALAIMVSDLETAERYSSLSPEGKKELISWRRPIVISPKKERTPLAPSLSPDNNRIGIMLPYTPLHHLLMEDFSALVMTSANESGEPLVSSNEEAMEKLSGVADAFLLNDREIVQKLDDSVLASFPQGIQVIRRARGCAPSPFKLWGKFPSILGVGAEMKNTFSLTKRDYLFLSHHIGDLENWESFEHFLSSLEHLKKLYRVEPEVIAYDLHPQYLVSQYAQSLDAEMKIPVQHHHAHIASVLFENRDFGPVIGVSCDGTGYGEDGAIWGMEFLLSRLNSFERFGHLEYVPLLGGEEAIRKPWRMGVSHLLNCEGGSLALPRKVFPAFERELEVLQSQWRKSFGSPLTSSAGRLFDAVSAILGFSGEITYEGQAAIILEREGEFGKNVFPLNFPNKGEEKFILDPSPLIREIAYRKLKGEDPRDLALSFHEAFARGILEACSWGRERFGVRKVALSGGVFQNLLLLSRLLEMLKENEFEVLLPKNIPFNDGSISVGQVAISCAKLEEKCV